MEARRFAPPWSFLFLRRLQHLCRTWGLSEDFPSETERPRSSCAGTTDTDTFAEYKSASHGKFGRSTSASRIEDKTEQKSAAKFPFVFEPPAGSRQQYTRSLSDGLHWLSASSSF